MESEQLEAYEERAAIMEYDGGLSRGSAEYMALKSLPPPPAAPPACAPGKMSQGYAEFREYWRSRTSR